MKLYLAHPLSMRKEVRRWELGFEHRTGIELVNPFYDNPDNPEGDLIEMIDNGLALPNNIRSKELCDAIVQSDLHQITQSDGIVAFYETGKESIGTPMEIFFSGSVLARPTYVITKSSDGHPWVRSIATEIFKNPYEFEKYIKP